MCVILFARSRFFWKKICSEFGRGGVETGIFSLRVRHRTEDEHWLFEILKRTRSDLWQILTREAAESGQGRPAASISEFIFGGFEIWSLPCNGDDHVHLTITVIFFKAERCTQPGWLAGDWGSLSQRWLSLKTSSSAQTFALPTTNPIWHMTSHIWHLPHSIWWDLCPGANISWLCQKYT